MLLVSEAQARRDAALARDEARAARERARAETLAADEAAAEAKKEALSLREKVRIFSRIRWRWPLRARRYDQRCAASARVIPRCPPPPRPAPPRPSL